MFTMYKSQASFIKCLIRMGKQDAASNKNICLPLRHNTEIRQRFVCRAMRGAGDSTYRSAPALHSGLGVTAVAVQTSHSAAQPSRGHRQLPQSRARCFQRTYKKPVVGSYVFLIQRKPGLALISRNISSCQGWRGGRGVLEKARSIYS